MGTNITGIGNANAIGFKSRVTGGIYFPPELKDALVGVWSAYGKSNDSTDRNIIKNKIKDRGGDFVISNAAFKLNSGFGGFVEDFTSWDRIDSSTAEISNDGSKIKCINTTLNVQYLFNYINRDISSFKVKISNFTKGDITYYYRKEDGIEAFFKITPLSVVNSDKVIELPKSYNTVENGTGSRGGFYSSNINIGVTIEQIPSFEGAFVTDGINDLITSTKTVQEMLGGSNEITVVSMIHGIGSKNAYTNVLRESGSNYIKNTSTADGKTGIYGYTSKDTTKSIITDILGDKNDYKLEHIQTSTPSTINSVFSVAGWRDSSFSMVVYPIAWYWTIIANKVLTTDQINQVIAYYNLDKYVKPDIYYNVKKQGLTNDTPDEDWYLKDFSGNGRDMTLYNYARTPESGINEEGGLQSDGVVDYGQFVGDLGLKDYTVVIDRAYNNLINNQVPLISSNIVEDQTPFIVEHWNTGSNAISFSYGASRTTDIPLDINKKIVYQSTYSYMGYVIPKGNAISTGNGITLGKFGNGVQYSAICLWSLMLFPYSISEFLIERQLKKHKLGTLYPDMVEFRPIVSYDKDLVSKLKYFYIPKYANWVSISPGDYLPNNAEISFTVDLRYPVDEVSSNLVFSNLENVRVVKSSGSGNSYDIRAYVTNKSPQKINITIDEYIRYEYIVQPYPVLLRFKDESGKEVSWGDKIKVGSSITRIGSFYDCNLLKGIYTVSNAKLNGSPLPSTPHVVERQMVFTCTATWAFDNNEPKCILSPSRLRIPNSSYKILGYIPDISGHGNHGKINNSAYAGASGANGYPYDYNNSSFWCDSVLAKVVSGELIEYFAVKNSTGFSNITSGVYKGEIKVTGVTKAISENKISRLRIYTNSTTDNELIDITQDGNYNIDIKGVGDANRVFFYAIPNNPNESIVVRLTEPIYIEQVGEYEGAYCLDGVDDFVTIPTLSRGGKQVLMKVNWQNKIGLLYDQRKNGSSIDAFAILNVNSNNSIAYNSRNTDGETYIDGILNKNIVCPQLYKITHSITIINQLANKEEVISPTIGSDTTHKVYFSQMSLYDFMLFDNISTDDKIKELNEYVGIEPKVELPPYYWDAYGKTNLDADKATIQQRGVAVGDYDITNYNHAYDKMSGYGGYEFAKFDNTIEWFAEDSSMVVNRNGYLITLKKVPNVAFWRFRNTTLKSLDNPLTFKVKCNKPIDVIFQVKFAKNNDVSIGYNYNIKEVTLVPNESTTIIVPSVSVSDIPEATSILFINVLFDNTSLSDNEEYTVEMLPLYPNGLVYDAITDYSENVNIPVFTDFTAIMKRKWLKNQGCPLIKGSKVYEGGNGNALLFEWDKAYNFVFYKRTDIMKGEVPENISFITPTNYNGNVITRGSGQDTNGICIAGDGNAGFANIVFYKLILYPKTIPLLQINFLKNLMERDEIIDLNNPIFIKNE